MVKEMNKKIFEQFLYNTVNEIIQAKGLQQGDYYFKIKPVREEGKSLLAKDEMMRLQMLPKEQVERHMYSIEEVVITLAFFAPYVPLWINVSYIKTENNRLYFQLETSLRIRKPSLMHNQETGHPPFKVII